MKHYEFRVEENGCSFTFELFTEYFLEKYSNMVIERFQELSKPYQERNYKRIKEIDNYERGAAELIGNYRDLLCAARDYYMSTHDGRCPACFPQL